MIVENFFKQCSKCLNYEMANPREQIGTCIRTFRVLHSNTFCTYPKYFSERPAERKEENTMIKFGDLLPLINCEFVVQYKGEIYHSFGNTLQSVLKEHFAGLTVKKLATFDDECLKVVLI